MRSRTWLWGMVVVILVATALRLPEFGSLPPGLYHDEAVHGLDTLDVLGGRLALYFPANNGREPLFIYLATLSVAVLGRSPFALRLPSLFAGILTIAATAAMGRALFSRRVGLLSAAVLSIMLWHVHLSRTGYRAVLLPLFAALAVRQGALGATTGRRSRWVASGALLGASLYTYTASRVTPFAIAAYAIFALAVWPRVRKLQFPRERRLWMGAGLAVLVSLAVAVPLLVAALLDPSIVLGRPGQVSVLSPEIHGGAPWATLGRHIIRTLGMFFVRGDRIWRHNLPGRPVFDPVLGAAFLLGLGLAMRRVRREPAAAFVIIWTGTMLLPTTLAEDAPHFLRAVGVLPVAATLPALGLDWVGAFGHRVLSRGNPGRPVGSRRLTCALRLALIVIPLAFGLASTARAYFATYATDPTTAFWFESGSVALAGRVNSFLQAGWDGATMLRGGASGRRAFIDPKLWDAWPQVRFLASDSASIVVGTSSDSVSDVSPATAAAFAWPYDGWQWAWSTLPSPRELTVELGPLSQGDRDPAPYRTYLAFYGAPPDQSTPALSVLAGGVEYLGVDLSSKGGDVTARLRWRATAPLSTDYTVFLHYLRDGELIGQADAGAASGLYPTSHWQPGDVINDDHVIEAIGEPLPGRDVLRFGFWQPDSGAVLHLLDEAGNPAGDWLEVPVGG